MKTRLLMLTAFVLFMSCKKENAPTEIKVDNSKVMGTWTFVNMSMNFFQQQYWSNGTDSNRQVLVYSVVSDNNKGEMVINDSTMTLTDCSYDYKTINKAYYYRNGKLEASSEHPSEFTLTKRSYVNPYKMINADSMYLGAGIKTYLDTFSSPTNAIGANIIIIGDTLYVRTIEEINGSNMIPDGIPNILKTVNDKTMRYTKKKL